MINTALDYNRKDRYIKEKTLPLNIEHRFNSTENEAISNLNIEDLLKLIQDLPVNIKSVFNLYVFEGYSHKQISEKLDITDSTSQWHMFNARRILAQKVKELIKTELSKIYE